MNFRYKFSNIFMIAILLEIMFFDQRFVNGNLIDSVHLRSFGIKPKPNPKTQMLYKLILEKKRQTYIEKESRRKKEQEEKHREEMKREEERRRIFQTYLARRVAGSFLYDFTYSGRF
jgi:hypothetical protein